MHKVCGNKAFEPLAYSGGTPGHMMQHCLLLAVSSSTGHLIVITHCLVAALVKKDERLDAHNTAVGLQKRPGSLYVFNICRFRFKTLKCAISMPICPFVYLSSTQKLCFWVPFLSQTTMPRTCYLVEGDL